MPLDAGLIYVVGRSSSTEKGRVWTINPKAGVPSFSQIKEFGEGGYTQCMGCVIHDDKLWVARAYNTNDGAVSYFNGNDWVDDITWGSLGKATDIVLFQNELYVMKKISATQCEVVKRTGPGTWTNVLTITVNSTDPPGGLQVITGSGGTQYLIAWPYTGFNASQHRFRYTTDGASWSAASTTGLPAGWKQFSYLHWDDTNSVYRLGIVSDANDYTAATIGGAWSAGAAHGHTAPYRDWGDVYTDENGDDFCIPYAGSQVRKFSGGSWSDKYSVGGVSQVDISNRAAWTEWRGKAYFVANATDGKLFSYDSGTDTWSTVASIGGLRDFTDLAGGPHMAMQFRGFQIKDRQLTQPQHLRDLGHITNIDFAKLVGDTLTAPPVGPAAGDTYIMPTGATGGWSAFASGKVVEYDGSTWNGISDLASTQAALIHSAGATGSFAGKEDNLAYWNGTNWNFRAPEMAMEAYVHNELSNVWDGLLITYEGADWNAIVTRRPGKIVGTALSWDTSAFTINVDYKGSAGLTTGASGLELYGQAVGGGGTTPTAADQIALKSYVDNVVTVGTKWRDPVSVHNVISDTNVTGPAAAAVGDGYIVNTGATGNWAAFQQGSLVEWDGNSWNNIVSGASSEPQDDLRVIVIASGATGSFANHEDQIGQYDAIGNSWSFTTKEDGLAVLVTGNGAEDENSAFVYDTSDDAWHQFTGGGALTAGTSIGIDGNTINWKYSSTGGLNVVGDEAVVKAGDGLDTNATGVFVDLVAGAGNPGLEITGGKLDAKLGHGTVNTANGIEPYYIHSATAVIAGSSGATGFDFSSFLPTGKSISATPLFFRNGAKQRMVAAGLEDIGECSFGIANSRLTFSQNDALHTGEVLDMFQFRTV